MKLDDFLKPKKVRCINGGNRKDLTDGKLYDVAGAACGRLRIRNDNGDELWYGMNCFELVIDSAENPLQKMELTPELEAVEPKFKAWDKVYIPNIKNICTITADGKVITSNGQYYCDLSDSYDLCFVLATPENHALLSKLYPHIEFEQPPTQADIDNEAVDKLAQAMKSKLAKKREQGYHGWATCKHGDLVQLLINHVDKGDPIDVANFCAFLFARGESLTGGDAR